MNIVFPDYEPRLKKDDAQLLVWCLARKKWVLFTKEEWVRQNWLNYLLNTLHYPASMIAVERGIQLGELKKRIDILVFKESLPWLLIECKEQDVSLTDKTIQQILSYQTVLQSGYLIISNGNETRGFQVKKGEILEINTLPSYV